MEKPSKDLRVVKTRQNIQNALIRLLAEKQVTEVTVTELAAAAMINRNTFYRHYSSVDDVIAEIEDDILRSLLTALKQSQNSCFKIGAVLRHMGAMIEENRDVLQKIAKRSPELLYAGRLKDMLRRSMEISLRDVGGVREERTRAMLSQFVVSGVLALYAEWLETGCRTPLDCVVDAAQNLTYGSLSSFLPPERLDALLLSGSVPSAPA